MNSRTTRWIIASLTMLIGIALVAFGIIANPTSPGPIFGGMAVAIAALVLVLCWASVWAVRTISIVGGAALIALTACLVKHSGPKSGPSFDGDSRQGQSASQDPVMAALLKELADARAERKAAQQALAQRPANPSPAVAEEEEQVAPRAQVVRPPMGDRTAPPQRGGGPRFTKEVSGNPSQARGGERKLIGRVREVFLHGLRKPIEEVDAWKLKASDMAMAMKLKGAKQSQIDAAVTQFAKDSGMGSQSYAKVHFQ